MKLIIGIFLGIGIALSIHSFSSFISASSEAAGFAANNTQFEPSESNTTASDSNDTKWKLTIPDRLNLTQSPPPEYLSVTVYPPVNIIGAKIRNEIPLVIVSNY